MLKTKDIMSCLPLLACILGKQYNITVEIGGTTAYTNGKTIHIPSLEIGTDEMYINMTRGYVDHEAHILDTQIFNCFRRPISLNCSFTFLTSSKTGGLKRCLESTFRDAEKISISSLRIFLGKKDKRPEATLRPFLFWSTSF